MVEGKDVKRHGVTYLETEGRRGRLSEEHGDRGRVRQDDGGRVGETG